MRFPKLLSMGTYATCREDHIHKPDFDPLSGGGYWRTRGKAKGEVYVRPGRALRLDINLRWRECEIDLSPLAKLRHDDLYALDISGHCFGDDQIKYIAGLTSLRALNLNWTGIGNAGLGHMQDLRSLETLTLHLTRVSDSGMVYLGSLTSLKYLDLSYTKVGDAGLIHLENLKGLEHLSLSSTNVTDAGIPHLIKLSSLRELRIDRTKITQEGVARLKEALPDCKISHSPRIEEVMREYLRTR